MQETDSSRQIMELIPRIMRMIRTEMRHHAKGDLTIPQVRILLKLTRGKYTHKEVAEWMGITPATLTRIIDSLVTRKLATRRTDPTDRRQVQLAPTPLGKRLAETYRDGTNRWIEGKVQSLTPSEIEQLEEGLTILDRLFHED